MERARARAHMHAHVYVDIYIYIRSPFEILNDPPVATRW